MVKIQPCSHINRGAMADHIPIPGLYIHVLKFLFPNKNVILISIEMSQVGVTMWQKDNVVIVVYMYPYDNNCYSIVILFAVI